MSKWITLSITLAWALAVFSSTAQAQAAAQYGALAGHSAVATTNTASRLAPKINQTSERQGARLRSVQSTMEENRRKLETEGQKSGGAVHIDSAPQNATIFVDGAPVAYTPADLKVSEGKHVIELKRATSLPWRKEISLAQDEKLSLNAALQERYKSTFTLSIQK
jgi:flagellar capping protein FliD